MAEFKYEIIKELIELSKSDKGWTKELTLISWNGKDAKYDLRDWSVNKEKMGKGVTLNRDELIKLKEFLNTIDL